MFFTFTNNCIYKFNLFNFNNPCLYWYNNNFLIFKIILLFKFNLIYNNFLVNFDILNYINIIEILTGQKPFLKKLIQKKSDKKLKKINPLIFYFFLNVNKNIFFNLYKYISYLIELHDFFSKKFDNDLKLTDILFFNKKVKKKLFIQKILIKHIFVLLNFFNFKYNENYCLKFINLYVHIYTIYNNNYIKKFIQNFI